MRAYYFDELPGDQRLQHDSGIPISNAQLAAVGVLVWHVPVEVSEASNFAAVDAIAGERDYRDIETISLTKDFLGEEEYQRLLKVFYSEHMHEDEEIRYILDGGGLFDVHESATNKWIRFEVNAGDLLLLPGGIYHRFTLDNRNLIKARLFHKDRLRWVPHYRGEASDNNPFRVEYLKRITVN